MPDTKQSSTTSTTTALSSTAESSVVTLHEQVRRLRHELRVKDIKIAELHGILQHKTTQCKKQGEQIVVQQEQIRHLRHSLHSDEAHVQRDKQLQRQDKEIAKLQRKVQQQTTQSQQQTTKLRIQEEQIEQLKKDLEKATAAAAAAPVEKSPPPAKRRRKQKENHAVASPVDQTNVSVVVNQCPLPAVPVVVNHGPLPESNNNNKEIVKFPERRRRRDDDNGNHDAPLLLDQQWDEKYQALKRHWMQVGHCRVSENDNGTLYRWVKTQRLAYTRGKISQARIALLEAIGFEWRVKRPDQAAMWEVRFHELVQYKYQYGTLHVPRSFENKQLALWVKRTYLLFLHAGYLFVCFLGCWRMASMRF